MILLFIFALFTGSVLSYEFSCKNGQEIKTRPLPSANLLVGNWSYTYHWDKDDKYDYEFVNDDNNEILDCPQLKISPIRQDFVENLKKKCHNDAIPFKWEDALLKMDAPLINLEDTMIVIGKTEHWLFIDCQRMLHVAALQVTEDIILMINPDENIFIDMLWKKPPHLSELKCIAHNIEIGKGLNGVSLCY